MDTHRLRPASPPLASPPLSPTVSSSSVSRNPPTHRRTQPPKSKIPALPRRLLLPTSCSASPSPCPDFRPVKSRTSNNRLTRSRADSAPPDQTQAQIKDERRWFNCDNRFEVLEENVKISGYQIFAVEKWIVDRARATILLTVYTGDPKDVVTVTVLAPASFLTNGEAQQEWDKVIHELRKDGARPRETDKGIIMVTSLANFRSDYTVVHIPDGDFLAHRQQLYVNINLLRMGCSGRSALTLQEPSDATKDRFISMFHFGDAMRTDDRFGQTVIELVRLIQCGLSLFGMFPIEFQEQDGLICDETVAGIQKWVSEIGEPYMKVEPSERVADPSIVSALLSSALSIRNKLSALGYQTVPKDPLLHPRQFTRCLAAFVKDRLAQTLSVSASFPSINHAYLNLTLIKHIDMAYEKHRSSEPYKLHRVVLSKIDDITSATTSAMTSSKDASRGRSISLSLSSKDRDTESLIEGTADVATFVSRIDFLQKKDCGASIRYLWTGKLDQLERKRQESARSDLEEERERDERSDSDDDGEVLGGFPWPNKVTKKIENWTGKEFGRNKSKKSSVDLSSGKSPRSLQNTPVVPSVVVSREFDGAMSGLSSGQASPASPSASYSNLGVLSSGHASALGMDEEEHSQRLAQFNKKWPSPVTPIRKRAFSWADQLSSVTLLDEVNVDVKAMGATVLPFPANYDPNAYPWTRQAPSPVGRKPSKPPKPKDRFLLKRKRSNSFDDREFLDPLNILSKELLQTDVDLCIQCLIMQRRKAHIVSIIALLQTLVKSSSASNEMLLKYHEEHNAVLKELEEKCQIVVDIEEAVSATDSASADTDALVYEANFLDTASLWRMAQGPRLRVFAIRDRVFGVGNRRRGFGLSQSGLEEDLSHGRFNRVQKRIDGKERLVDFMGRTESDVEEEGDLPEDVRFGSDEDSEGDKEPHTHDDMHISQESRFEAINNWLLELFTRWGRVLGVRRDAAAAPEANAMTTETSSEKTGTEQDPGNYFSPRPAEEIKEQPMSFRRPVHLGNGHFKRLSTVGEEDEPASSPGTPTNSSYFRLSGQS